MTPQVSQLSTQGSWREVGRDSVVSIALRDQTPSLGRIRFNNSQHGSAASPPIMPATKLGSGKLKTEFHNSPAIQLAASIATMVSSRRCQIGNVGCIAFFPLLISFVGVGRSPLPRLFPPHASAERSSLCQELNACCGKSGNDPFPYSTLDMAVALLFRDMYKAAHLEPMQRARCDLCRGSELTNAEVGEGTRSGELLAVVGGDVGAHPSIMMRLRFVSIVPKGVAGN